MNVPASEHRADLQRSVLSQITLEALTFETVRPPDFKIHGATSASSRSTLRRRGHPPLGRTCDGAIMRTVEKLNEDDTDIDLGTATEPPPRLPNGENYVVGFLRGEKGMFCGKLRIFLWFQVIEPGEHAGRQLYLCCPIPENGKFGIGSKFVEAWRVATGRWPTRRDRLTPKVFRGCYFRAALRTVTRNQYGDERPESQHYSKIDRLIERVNGG